VIMRWYAWGPEGDDETLPPSLPLAFGISFSLGILGQFLALFLMPMILQHVSLEWSLIISACVTGSGLLCTFIFAFMDKIAAPKLDLDYGKTEGGLSIKVVSKFRKSYWVLLAIYSLGYIPQAVGLAFITDYLTESYTGYDEVRAGRTASVAFAFSLVTSPCVGLFMERLGHGLTLMCLGCTMFVVANVLMLFKQIPPLVSLGILGTSYAIVPASIWPSINTVIPEGCTGTAFAVMYCISSLGYLVVPVGIGWMHDNFPTLGYTTMNYAFIISGSIALFLALTLVYVEPEFQKPLNYDAVSTEAINDEPTVPAHTHRTMRAFVHTAGGSWVHQRPATFHGFGKYKALISTQTVERMAEDLKNYDNITFVDMDMATAEKDDDPYIH